MQAARRSQRQVWEEAVGARRTHSTEVFAVTWSNRGVTVVTASGPEEARQHVSDSGRDRLFDWLATGHLRVPNLVPVTQLEIGVGPRRTLNAPTFCHVKMRGQSITWIAPGSGALDRSWKPRKGGGERPPAVPMRIWSYVWQARELVFFDAPDFESACDRALDRAGSWGFAATASRHLVSANVEPVERLGIDLRPPSLRSAPQRYWAWIEGVRVGWPPIEPETSAASMPAPPESPGSPSSIYALPPGLRYIG